MNPHPEILWTRYQVHTGALPPDFKAAALVQRVLEAGRGRVELTPEALDWARETGLLASGLPEAPLADSGKDLATVSEEQIHDAMTLLTLADKNPRLRLEILVSTGDLPPGFTTVDLLRYARATGWEWTRAGYERAKELDLMGTPAAPATAKTEGHLAADVGAGSWGELHVAFSTSGLRVKKKGAPGEGRLVKWQDLGWKVKEVNEDERILFLGRMAAGGGSFQEQNSLDIASRRKRIAKDLCEYFGLPCGRGKGPFFYGTGRSQTRFGVFCMASEVLKDAPGKQPFRDEDIADSERTKHDRARRDALYGVDDNEDRM